VETVGNEEGHDNGISGASRFVPLGDQRFLFHVGVPHFAIDAARRDALDSRFAATAELSFKSVPWPTIKEARIPRLDSGGDLRRPMHQQFRHAW